MTYTNRLPDSDYLRAVRQAYSDGATDALDGGVPIAEVAERLDRTPSPVRARLDALAESGDLVVVTGLNPDTKHPRKGYIPAEEGDSDFTHLSNSQKLYRR